MKKRCRKSGKVKFNTHEQAATRAGEILTGSVHPVNVKFLQTYQCPFCNHWHITSAGQREFAL